MKMFIWLKKLFTGDLSIVDKQELFFLRQLESENKTLHKDIYNLVCNPNKPEGISVKMRYEMNYDLTGIMWKATRDSKEHLARFCGIFDNSNHD